MNNTTNWEKIIIFLDHKPDKVQVVHMDNPSLSVEIPIEISATGNKTITINNNIFGVEIEPIDIFEKEDVPTRLDNRQEALLYRCWGEGSSIMISRTADAIGIEKSIAKELIILAQRHGILCVSYNNTWKIKDSVTIKSRWIDKAIQLQKGSKPEKAMDSNSVLDRYAEKAKELNIKGFERPIKGEKGMIVQHDKESSVNIIPEEPINKSEIYIEQMKKRIKQLEVIVKDTNRNDIHDRIKELSGMKVQLYNAENGSSQKCHNTDIKMNESGSVVNITKIEPKKLVQPAKKILTKGKPSPVNRVRKP